MELRNPAHHGTAVDSVRIAAGGRTASAPDFRRQVWSNVMVDGKVAVDAAPASVSRFNFLRSSISVRQSMYSKVMFTFDVHSNDRA